ncbi:MAG TPA: LPS export ABC transporter permease LptG [Burkholderiales bacterium]|nr:LPS export ABC transporter permease LptG [Burkholderiales bacterium]
MISLLDRYIAERVVFMTGLTLLVQLALMIFFVVVDVLPDFGQANFNLYEMLRYVFLSQPRRLYEIFPVVTLIGTLLGLSTLASNAELVAMRAAGVSVSTIVGSAVKVGLAFAVIVVLVGEYVVPWSESQAQSGRAQALARGMQKKASGLWLRDQNTFVNIGEVLPDLSLLNVNIYAFADGIDLRLQTHASSAFYTKDEGWVLEGVEESRIAQRGIAVQHIDEKSWKTDLTEDIVGVFTVRPEGLSMQHLVRYIDHLKHNGQSTERYRLALWQKALMPIAVVVMVLLATPFVFGPVRGGALSRNIFWGIMLGLAFILVTRLFGHFGLLYGLPPVVGAALPVLLFFGGALYLLRKAH